MRILGLGAGVQSSTVALMGEHKEIEPFDYAIFADTQHEPSEVYSWLDWLEGQLSYPVHRVTQGNLWLDSMEKRTSKLSGKNYVRTLVPFFIKKADGSSGPAWRKCTRDYKITPMRREIQRLRKIYGNPDIKQTMGISLDEIQRIKVSQDAWCEFEYPLIDLKMTRTDCKKWMAAKGYPEPPRSACYFCPYHSAAEWQRIKDTDPKSFAMAAEFERQAQAAVASHCEVTQGIPYLWKGGPNITDIDWLNIHQSGQLSFLDECEGMCGV